jgi:uncharacterized membrane protein
MAAASVSRFFRLHWKIVVALGAGAAIYFLLPPGWSTIMRSLTAWNVTVLVLLPITYLLVSRLSSTQLRQHYKEEDPSAPVILVLVVAAAILSVVAIVAFLTTLKHAAPADRLPHVLLATLTIVDSWLIVPTIFTLHYADLFYSADPRRPPLLFPNTAEPVFWDFAYFSFTIAAACQTADVSTCTVDIRKTVIVHSIVSVLFNVSILGFAVNVTAGLLA